YCVMSALVQSLCGTITLTEKQKANTDYEGLNGHWARHAAQVTSSVSGDIITIEILFPSVFPKATVKYMCKSTEGALECRTPNGYEAALKKLEKDAEPAPRYTCSTKFQHCPTQD